MAYQGLDNKTDSEAEIALLADENGRDVLLVLVKTSYDIADDGSLSLSEEQEPICFEGEYFGEPGQSSLKIAPEANFEKLATDVVLIGQAYAPGGQAVTQFDAGLQVADLRQHIRVFGDRIWQKRTTAKRVVTWEMSAPQPIVQVPLIYENAFGGEDLSPDEDKHYAFDPRNLIGTGVIAKNSKLDKVPLPNLEDPKQLIRSPEDRPQPVGMGFISPDWQPRLGYSGTYDENWEKTRLPMLPLDFNRTFFNAAHPRLIAQGFLQGSETIHTVNVTPQGRLSIQLPGDKPEISFKYQHKEPKKLEVKLDTIIINTDEMKLILLWRASEDVFNRIYKMEKIIVEDVKQETPEKIPDDYDLMS